MYFSQQALNEMSEARKAIGGKYQSLLMEYVTLPLKDAIAREYATQGFPRRLGVMAHCIHNVFRPSLHLLCGRLTSRLRAFEGLMCDDVRLGTLRGNLAISEPQGSMLGAHSRARRNTLHPNKISS